MAENQMTLGEFVKYLAALLSNDSTSMLFKNEAPWHYALYRLQSEKVENKPSFVNSLVFDWGGPFPKCQDLSRYLQLLHVTGCAHTTNPSYERMELKQGLAKLWYAQVGELPGVEQEFMNHAAAIAKQEFAQAD